MGQNTGTSNIGKKVAVKPMSSALRLLHLRQANTRQGGMASTAWRRAAGLTPPVGQRGGRPALEADQMQGRCMRGSSIFRQRGQNASSQMLPAQSLATQQGCKWTPPRSRTGPPRGAFNGNLYPAAGRLSRGANQSQSAGAHQNLNSGSRRTKGRNSSSDLLGRVGSSSSGLTWGLQGERGQAGGAGSSE